MSYYDTKISSTSDIIRTILFTEVSCGTIAGIGAVTTKVAGVF